MLAIDRYGLTIECEGIDASAEQVRARMASVFDRYVTDRSLYGVKDEARAAQRVLWADPDAVQPWQWRRAAALGECPEVVDGALRGESMFVVGPLALIEDRVHRRQILGVRVQPGIHLLGA